MDVQASSFSGMVFTVAMFTVARLVRINTIVRNTVTSESIFHNAFSDFGYERKIRDRAIIG